MKFTFCYLYCENMDIYVNSVLIFLLLKLVVQGAELCKVQIQLLTPYPANVDKMVGSCQC